jgi:hypothetical protein
MSTPVDMLLQKLTIPEKVEVLQILLDVLPEDVMWPNWVEGTGGNLDEYAEELKLHGEGVELVEWPANVAAAPDHYLKRLSLFELALLTETLWAEVADKLPIPEWHIELLEERLKLVESGEGKFYTLDEVKEMMSKKFGP